MLIKVRWYELPTTVMDGTEQTIFENTELGEYNGFIFLDEMLVGDNITLRCYIKDIEDEIYKLRDSKSFSGVQGTSCIGFRPTVGKVGMKITAQQTSGTYRTLHHMWFKR